MQWDKVKNILLVILLLVDGFLGWSIASRYLDIRAQERAFAADLSAVLERKGLTYSGARAIPPLTRAIPLSIDRSRTAEERFAAGVLTGTLETETNETGDTAYIGANGTVVWRADGTVNAQFTAQNAAPANAAQQHKQAKDLLAACGVSLRGGALETDLESNTVQLTATVANLPVFDRALKVKFINGNSIRIEGKWTFETPYASTRDQERAYSAADALLSLAAREDQVTRIERIELGYRMTPGVSGRLQLTPTWRVQTDRGESFVDALKKNSTPDANIVD